MTQELVPNAPRLAYWRRKPKAGLVHHSDRGSQYYNRDYRKRLERYGMQASMSHKSNCWDNVMTESFYNGLKSERVSHEDYSTRAQAKVDLMNHIEAFYNQVRRHFGLGYRSLEQRYAARVVQRKRAA